MPKMLIYLWCVQRQDFKSNLIRQPHNFVWNFVITNHWKQPDNSKTHHFQLVRQPDLDSPFISTLENTLKPNALKNINKVASAPGLSYVVLVFYLIISCGSMSDLIQLLNLISKSIISPKSLLAHYVNYLRLYHRNELWIWWNSHSQYVFCFSRQMHSQNTRP
jgi:hypothetical protein